MVLPRWSKVLPRYSAAHGMIGGTAHLPHGSATWHGGHGRLRHSTFDDSGKAETEGKAPKGILSLWLLKTHGRPPARRSVKAFRRVQSLRPNRRRTHERPCRRLSASATAAAGTYRHRVERIEVHQREVHDVGLRRMRSHYYCCIKLGQHPSLQQPLLHHMQRGMQ